MKRLAAFLVTALGCRAILGIDEPVVPDAATADAVADASPCLAAPLYTPTFDSSNQAAQSFGSGAEIEWVGALDGTTDIELALRTGTSDFPTTLGPNANIDLGALDNTQLSTCGACFLVAAGLDGSGNVGQVYLAVSGQLDIIMASPTAIAGSFANVIVTPVTVDANQMSTRIDQACVTTLASGSFSAAVTAGSAQ